MYVMPWGVISHLVLLPCVLALAIPILPVRHTLHSESRTINIDIPHLHGCAHTNCHIMGHGMFYGASLVSSPPQPWLMIRRVRLCINPGRAHQ